MSIDGIGYQHAKYKKVVVFFNVDKQAREIAVSDYFDRLALDRATT